MFAVPQAPVRVFGLRFSNPVGLAAGYDKDGLGWRSLACLGFGHIEVGTVTPIPQPGNPRPRVFRLPEDQAVINRMGFPSRGAQFVAERLQGKRPPGLVLGVNLGKNKDTPLELAWQDYEQLVDIFAPLADYLVVNVSSPNTVGLRQLQARHFLEELLAHVVRRRDAFAEKRVPVLVKLSPDLSDGELEDALEALLGAGMDGVIATNTTISRPPLRSPHGSESGGLSGAPLASLSARFVREIVQRTEGKLPVVATGGIMNADDARRRLDDWRRAGPVLHWPDLCRPKAGPANDQGFGWGAAQHKSNNFRQSAPAPSFAQVQAHSAAFDPLTADNMRNPANFTL